MHPEQTAEIMLETALTALDRGNGWEMVLNELPVPVYIVAADGAVTYWNQACVDFAGRQPQIGKDRWCVTWQLVTTEGASIPHDECPMAAAVKARRDVRGQIAIAMRPDGSRRAFRPYPTPLFNPDGDLTGAVNLLVDITDEQAVELGDQAKRCRRLAQATLDPQASQILNAMARNYDEMATALAGTGKADL